MAKDGWLQFEDLMILERKIVAVRKEKSKVIVYLQGGHKFSLSKSEGRSFWESSAAAITSQNRAP